MFIDCVGIITYLTNFVETGAVSILALRRLYNGARIARSIIAQVFCTIMLRVFYDGKFLDIPGHHGKRLIPLRSAVSPATPIPTFQWLQLETASSFKEDRVTNPDSRLCREEVWVAFASASDFHPTSECQRRNVS